MFESLTNIIVNCIIKEVEIFLLYNIVFCLLAFTVSNYGSKENLANVRAAFYHINTSNEEYGNGLGALECIDASFPHTLSALNCRAACTCTCGRR